VLRIIASLGIVIRALSVVAILTFMCVSPGRANVLYDNLGDTPTGADPIGSDWGPLGNSFSTGASPFDFTSLTVLLDGTASSGTITAYLLADSSTSPGAVLETIGEIDESVITGSPTQYTLDTSFTLSADTRYWIELTATDNAAGWDWSNDVSGPGVASQYYSNYEKGDIVRVFPNSPTGPYQGPYQMEVSGSLAAVPEPRTISLLLAAGLVGLGFLRATVKTRSV
jgi:hypothetical protein